MAKSTHVPVTNFEPAFFFCHDLVRDNAKAVKTATNLTSSSIMPDPSHFSIVNNEYVVKNRESMRFTLLTVLQTVGPKRRFGFVQQISVTGRRATRKYKI